MIRPVTFAFFAFPVHSFNPLSGIGSVKNYLIFYCSNLDLCVGNELPVSPALAEVSDERQLVSLEFLVFWGMRIIESPHTAVFPFGSSTVSL